MLVLVAALVGAVILSVEGGSLLDRFAGSSGVGPSGDGSSGADDASDSAIVDRVVDGDTVIVDLGGERTRIRLLNIDTPESVDPHRPVECLGVEASAFLAELLPDGTAVRLGYDDEREDRYGRILAAVFLDDGTLVNAEIARAGLGEAVVFGGNDRYLSVVQDAEAEAVDAGRGLHDAAGDCAA
ncbi:thermonuclease family protein [Planctomonas psychrotolerans]|uniref:thermonuclease family protein n=1 Tax=Planctomonas psychrotolerans TaxID=2528712 RepID=UPI001D0D1861|nr:thermonuclease family protein [Planctomonas psychrotolerans]